MQKSFKDLLVAKFGSVYAAAMHFKEKDYGISYPYIYKLASGEYSNVTISLLPILCKELDVDIIDLLESFGIDTDVV